MALASPFRISFAPNPSLFWPTQRRKWVVELHKASRSKNNLTFLPFKACTLSYRIVARATSTRVPLYVYVITSSLRQCYKRPKRSSIAIQCFGPDLAYPSKTMNGSNVSPEMWQAPLPFIRTTAIQRTMPYLLCRTAKRHLMPSMDRSSLLTYSLSTTGVSCSS